MYWFGERKSQTANKSGVGISPQNPPFRLTVLQYPIMDYLDLSEFCQSCPTHKRRTSNFTLSRIRGNTALSHRVGIRRRNIFTAKIDKEACIRLFEGSWASKSIDLADMSKVGRANLICTAVRRGKQLTLDSSLNNSRNILEDIALCKNVSTWSNLKSMAVWIVPVVVDLDARLS